MKPAFFVQRGVSIFSMFRKKNSLMRLLLLSALMFSASVLCGQSAHQPPATSSEDRFAGFEKRQNLIANSLIHGLKFDNIGPTVFSGRVTDIEVSPSDPTHFYVAYASGGLWYTDNNGTTFEPIFDNEAVISIGDIAVDWNSNTIWVGTGENNSSRSSYSGVGMYRSNDHGETWTYKGLPESHHIGRIVLHPGDPNIIYTAVTGHLYSPNSERGVYMSTDGGNSWSNILFVNPDCGAIDLVMDPNNSDVLYAAMWERNRRAWNFTESGSGSGIYRTDDGGANWQLITDENSGFPTGTGAGRIGLDIIDSNGETFVCAILDNYFRRPPDAETDAEQLTRDDLRTMSREQFLELDPDLVTEYLEDNNFPEKYDYDAVLEMIEHDKISPLDLVEYLEDANSLLFDTDVIGAEVYISSDNGSQWKKTHEGYIDRLYNTYGYYFGQVRFSPVDKDKMYILGVPILKSSDRGATWSPINGANVHADHHALWVNPSRKGHLILGNDGGINISYDDGENWIKCNSPSVGQFYYVHLDRAKPYNVYGGLQDNGVWGGPHTYRGGVRWHSSGSYPYKSYLGGDGMQVQVDYRDNNTMYTGFQFGNYFKIDMSSGKRDYITPRHELGQRPFRWNWQTPVLISRHQQDIIYIGSNYLHRSFDQGESFEIISHDLTRGGIVGDVPYGTLTTIHESPLKFGLIYTGSDDGMVYVTRDMGVSWDSITHGLPSDMWVTRVQASQHEAGRVYCALNGYRWDDFNSYLFVSDDYGQNWKSIGDGLPTEPVNVVKEDHEDPTIIYVGTDHGLYISFDRGATYHSIGPQLPAVPIHDLEIQPDEGHLVIATHGRSFYLADINPMRKMAQRDSHGILVLVDDLSLRRSSRWGNRSADWADFNTPAIEIPFYSDRSETVRLRVLYEDGTIYTDEIDARRGLNYAEYDLSAGADYVDSYSNSIADRDMDVPEKGDNGNMYLVKGKYTIVLESGGQSSEVELEIK